MTTPNTRTRILRGALLLLATLLPAGARLSVLEGQVTIHPRTVTPAAWERFTVSVVNATNDAVVGVRVEIPDAVTVLGVLPGDWRFAVVPGTDTTAQYIEWTEGAVRYPALGEFAFLGRVAGDARKKTLVFPVVLTHEEDATVVYRSRPGSVTAAPTVEIVGRATISVRGAVALGGAAIGIAMLALALAALKRPVRGGRTH